MTKTFCDGRIIANKNINIKVKHNKIHIISGENRKGKSALMPILFDLYQPNEVKIYIDGKKVNIKNTAKANKSDLVMIHEHFKLIVYFKVLEYVILGKEKNHKKGFLNSKKPRIEIEKICQEYNFKVELMN